MYGFDYTNYKYAEEFYPVFTEIDFFEMTFEKYFNNVLDFHVESYKDDIKKLTNRKDFPDGYISDLDSKADTFFKIQKSRTLYLGIINLYSFFEVNLIKILTISKEVFDTKISYNDLNGKILEQFKTYIKKVLEIEASEILDKGEVWKNLLLLKTVRNCIVHRNGEVSDRDRKAILEFIKETKASNISIPSEYIEFNEKFLLSQKDNVIVLLNKSIELIWNKRIKDEK